MNGMKMDKCYRCTCAYCGNEDCDDWCDMKEHCSHDSVVKCPNFKADQSSLAFASRSTRLAVIHWQLWKST